MGGLVCGLLLLNELVLCRACVTPFELLHFVVATAAKVSSCQGQFGKWRQRQCGTERLRQRNVVQRSTAFFVLGVCFVSLFVTCHSPSCRLINDALGLTLTSSQVSTTLKNFA